MNTVFLSQLLTYSLPIIGLVLPGIFKQDGLSNRANGGIAFVVVALVSVAQAFCAGQLGWNFYIDLLAVTGGITGLLSGPLKWLDQYVQSNLGLTSPRPLPALPVYPPTTLRASRGNPTQPMDDKSEQ
jgi:hypothetical protein